MNKKFVNYNANPRNAYTSDCVARALSKVYGKDYSTVLRDLKTYNLTPEIDNPEYYKVWYNVFRLIEKYGYLDYTPGYELDHNIVRDFIVDHPEGSYLIHIHNPEHMTCVVDGLTYDTWNCNSCKIEDVWRIK